MIKRETILDQCDCPQLLLEAKDSLDVLQGKWKLPILITLKLGDRRFKEIAKEVHGITDKVLSKELKDLEINQLITRTVYETFPPKVMYSLTDHGQSLESVIQGLWDWGKLHRKKIIGK